MINDKIAAKNTERKFAVLELRLEDYANKLKATGLFDNQAKEYFESQNKKSKKYWAPEKRSATIWVIKPENYGLQVSEKEIKDYLLSNKNVNKEQAQKALLNQKFKRLFDIDAKRVTSELTNTEKFSEFAKNKKATESKITDFESDGSLKSRAIFSLKLNQKIHYIDENNGYIVELNKISPAHQYDFEKVKSAVLNDLYSEKSRDLLMKDLAKYNQELGTKKIEDIAKEYSVAIGVPLNKVSLEKTDWINAKTAEKCSIFEKKKIDPNILLQMTHKGSHIAYPGTQNNGFIISVIDTRHLDHAAFAGSRQELEAAANQEAFQQIIYSFIASLNKNAKIVYNTSSDSAI